MAKKIRANNKTATHKMSKPQNGKITNRQKLKMANP